MQIAPIHHSDFDLVEIKTTNACSPTPHCKIHGAMNKVTSDGIWRCIASTGFKAVTDGNARGKLHIETFCKAACLVIT